MFQILSTITLNNTIFFERSNKKNIYTYNGLKNSLSWLERIVTSAKQNVVCADKSRSVAD